MPLIDKIVQMQKQGLSTEDIVNVLKDEGFSPKEVDEAIEQSKVKAEISGQDEMQPSMMTNDSESNYPDQGQSQSMQPPFTQEMYPDTGGYQPQVPYPQMPMQQMQQPMQMQQQSQSIQGAEYPAEYPQYQEYQNVQPNTDMISEIAEQVVAEKMQKIEKQISDLAGLKTEVQGKISNVEDRLKRIETIIDRLQASVIEKIGDYGKNIYDIKQEMLATQDSFSKVLTPLGEQMEKIRKIAKGERNQAGRIEEQRGERKQPESFQSKKPRRDGFEGYMRE